MKLTEQDKTTIDRVQKNWILDSVQYPMTFVETAYAAGKRAGLEAAAAVCDAHGVNAIHTLMNEPLDSGEESAAE